MRSRRTTSGASDRASATAPSPSSLSSDVEPRAAQVGRHDLAQDGVVVDDEDGGHVLRVGIRQGRGHRLGRRPRARHGVALVRTTKVRCRRRTSRARRQPARSAAATSASAPTSAHGNLPLPPDAGEETLAVNRRSRCRSRAVSTTRRAAAEASSEQRRRRRTGSPTDPHVPVEEQDDLPRPGTRHVLEHRPQEHRQATVGGQPDRLRRDVDTEGEPDGSGRPRRPSGPDRSRHRGPSPGSTPGADVRAGPHGRGSGGPRGVATRDPHLTRGPRRGGAGGHRCAGRARRARHRPRRSTRRGGAPRPSRALAPGPQATGDGRRDGDHHDGAVPQQVRAGRGASGCPGGRRNDRAPARRRRSAGRGRPPATAAARATTSRPARPTSSPTATTAGARRASCATIPPATQTPTASDLVQREGGAA